MEPIFALIGLVVVFVVGFKLFILVSKYFDWIEKNYNYNPVDKINKFWFVFGIVGAIIAGCTPLGDMGIIIVFVSSLFIILFRNIKNIKNPIHIIFVSILQMMFIILVLIIGIIGGMRTNTGTIAANANYDKGGSDWVNQSWKGHEYDNQRANELGFATVEDAKKAGYDYNGVYRG